MGVAPAIASIADADAVVARHSFPGGVGCTIGSRFSGARHTQIQLCANLRWLDEVRLTELFGLVDEVGRILTVLRQNLRKHHTRTNS